MLKNDIPYKVSNNLFRDSHFPVRERLAFISRLIIFLLLLSYGKRFVGYTKAALC